MSRYLFRISYGPVQPFIAASRRTRDLGSGSELLVKVGRWIQDEAANRANGIEWVFPHDKGAAAANILQFVASTDDPARLARDCRTAVVRRFREAYDRLDLPSGDLAERQFDAYLQFFAAWEPLAEGSDYEQANRRVQERLAVRKALRTFPVAPSHEGVRVDGRVQYPPKSPLLPSLDCVLPLDGIEVDASAQQRYLVDPYEFLDGISLLKRRTIPPKPFPSTLSICAMGAVSQLGDESTTQRFKSLVEKAAREGYDEDPGDLLYEKALEDAELREDEDRRPTNPAPPDMRREVEDIRARIQQAGIRLRAYYAVLHADGDGMGARISRLQTIQEHREFSQNLARGFTESVEPIVERHHGRLVYAGGDDVLALIPAETVLDCAVELNQKFCESVPGCTLSVGVAVVHARHSLQHAVGLSRQLEGYAKKHPGKNALAFGVYPRNGGETVVRLGFGGDDAGPLSLQKFREHVSKWSSGVPRSLPYDLRAEAERLPSSPLPWVVPGAYQRIVQRKRLEVGAKLPPEWVNDRRSLLAYADHLAVAHFLTRGGSR
ncbi:MAG: type III-B CRISPR-associated protein Cas10/Cmr2 [Fimbriimonadales bacterium]